MMNKGALTLAEGHWDKNFKTNADLSFDLNGDKKKFVVRTTLDDIGSWRSKLQFDLPLSTSEQPSIAPFSKLVGDMSPRHKKCAFINNELWVFKVNGTIATDIMQAVQIGMQVYNAYASDIIGDVYVKNYNAEYQNEMHADALVEANKRLYQQTFEAIREAAKLLGVNSGALNFWILSNIKNWKIPKEDLHQALRDGGAQTVGVSKNTFPSFSRSNDGTTYRRPKNHLHRARYQF